MHEKLKIVSFPSGMTHIIPMKGYLEDHGDWYDTIGTIENSGPNDTIHFKINCGGGSVYIMVDILQAMRKTEAHIITEIVGDCASAATFIFLNGDEHRVNKYSEMMLHEAQISCSGGSSNLMRGMNFSQKQTKRLINEEYKYFLSEEEIVKVLDGVEVWIGESEILERLAVRNRALDKESGALTEEEEKALPHKQLLAYLYDDNYSPEDWVIEEVPVEGAVTKSGRTSSVTVSSFLVDVNDNVTREGQTDILFNLSNTPAQLSGKYTAKELKVFADGLGVPYSLRQSGTQVAEGILNYLKDMIVVTP